MSGSGPAGKSPEVARRRAPSSQGVSGVSVSRLRRLQDVAGRWLVSAAGASIILSILGILVFIVLEVAPLLFPAKVEFGPPIPWRGRPTAGVLVDETRARLVVLDVAGGVRVLDAGTGTILDTWTLLEGGSPPGPRPSDPATAECPQVIEASAQPLDSTLSVLCDDGTVRVQAVGFESTYGEDGSRTVHVRPDPVVALHAPLRDARPLTHVARLDEGGGLGVAVLMDDGRIEVLRRRVEENPFTGEVSSSESEFSFPAGASLRALLMDRAQKNLFASSADGAIVWWPLGEAGAGEPVRAASGEGLTVLQLLKGDRALLAGRRDGAVEVWFPLTESGHRRRLAQVRAFTSMPGAPIRALAPSPRNKGFFALDEQGRLGLFYSTSERTLWTGRLDLEGPRTVTFAPKANGAFVSGAGALAPLEVYNPHPEAGFKAFFAKIWYEGAPGPEYVWQSAGGTDDFEPKLSLVPLIHGTLKGTFYSLLLAVPLGVLGAMYTAYFMHPSFRRYIKPTVEIMAALPSVVLGFLAGLWLAPRVERYFPAIILMHVLIPAGALVLGALWVRIPRRHRARFPDGAEIGLFVVGQAAIIGLCLWLGPGFERLAFDGSFSRWLLETTGTVYDQRNAIVVGMAMGFAVIPIIFSVSEDAFSNVPRSLISGSLALGATAWQTVTRVVLPTASPGIFSAVMIGFGRAVGETMIVLMATGNTPIMDWSPFNGFRTLSANIAVEIPEAPVDGTLYRTLFLAALILFVMTFLVNTLAEIVRQRLRRRYSSL